MELYNYVCLFVIFQYNLKIFRQFFFTSSATNLHFAMRITYEKRKTYAYQVKLFIFMRYTYYYNNRRDKK